VSRKGKAPCTRTFTSRPEREPVTAAQLALDEKGIAAEFIDLWDGRGLPVTLEESCAKLPVMKTGLPRTAKVALSMPRAG
jgi:hypothetical protein